ncbi:hypothetical protein [Xenorhabdus bovienii]|uniref:Uncharacterized protein n=1 Tax=Xenorhabdus bovienii str. kraussei Becker Underwood TaxID=1398204 RepID=A0A077PZZ0_XENBV|nr:hypothetical protein [Xenorhabdus bovienii]CDH26738.1 hypothetical protein XBKB1_910003 [Xenorhabdus bovienii str. kraussei Becker Underwood]
MRPGFRVVAGSSKNPEEIKAEFDWMCDAEDFIIENKLDLYQELRIEAFVNHSNS